jgi:hypothetical protein
VNVNSAPVPVLRSLPGMTDATLNRILMLRSQGRRISRDEIFPAAATGGGGGRGNVQVRVAGQVQSQAVQTQFQNRITVTADNIELTMLARVGPQSQPTKLVAVLGRAGTNAQVGNLLW